MKLRTIGAGLSALALAVAVFPVGLAQTRSLFDLFRLFPPAHHSTQSTRHARSAGSLSEREALALYSPAQRRPSFDACVDQFPAERPLMLAIVPSAMQPLALCSDHFAVLYSQTSKTPLVVVERLSAARIEDARGEVRTNVFYADPRLPAGARADLADYRSQHPAVDRGHQAPAADAPDAQSMAQSFSLSNMVPQDPLNNRKVWAKVESDVRKFARRARGNVYVYTGPIFDGRHETVGRNKVWVPTRLFKLVYDEASGRAWAYVLPNAATRLEKPIDYDDFVDATGLALLGKLRVTGGIRS